MVGNENTGAASVERDEEGRTEAGDPSQGGPTGAGEVKTLILVDVSNVAHGKTSGASPPTVANLRRVLDRLREYPVSILAIADASLRYKIDLPRVLEALFASGELEQVPAGTGADDFLWQLWKSAKARGTRSYILTNDRFPNTRIAKDSAEVSPRIAFLLVGNEVVFQPPLEDILKPGTHSKSDSRPPAPVSDPLRPSPRSPHERNMRPTRPSDGPPAHEPATRSSSDADRRVPLPVGARDETSSPPLETGIDTELVTAAIEAIAAKTNSPEGDVRRVNFAAVSHALHQRFDGDFVTRFRLRRAKELADALSKSGLVVLSHTNSTLYVEPTPTLDGRAENLGFGRLPPTARPALAALPLEPFDQTPRGREPHQATEPGLPVFLEVSSRELGPTVEIDDPDVFLGQVRAKSPKHLFHWWSKTKGSEGILWQRQGEFFFVLDGITFRLVGHGYRTLTDFLDGRARGLKGVDDPSVIGDPDCRRESPWGWRTVLEYHKLDDMDNRPSEGDVYYLLQSLGFPTLASFLASEKAKERSGYW